ncbi:MazG family protein [Candidatus Koribacter versatilis Ellin345]|uniref:MazG family protein n=2 Tax=Candidatus Korobacter versatilis TaxID=658062 RepID=Q1IPL4_KORVE|nr:MazG family protein [Candidatus Koribacter versatilis Ellin345]
MAVGIIQSARLKPRKLNSTALRLARMPTVERTIQAKAASESQSWSGRGDHSASMISVKVKATSNTGRAVWLTSCCTTAHYARNRGGRGGDWRFLTTPNVHEELHCGAMTTTGDRFERAVAIMKRLRAPGGCPWDREQTFDTIKPFTLEETYEVIEAIDNRDWDELPGELGDLLLQILFYAQMAAEEGKFTIDEVVETLSNKLVNRHPHVFGTVEANTAAEVVRNWEMLKAQERAASGKHQAKEAANKSLLAGVSLGLPGLIEAGKISNKAAGVGFEWPKIEGLFEKLTEETVELREELKHFPGGEPTPPSQHGIASSTGEEALEDGLRARLEDEIGDLLFTVVNLARYVRVDPESALKRTNRKFRARFLAMEQTAEQQGRKLDGLSLEELEELWQQSKRVERDGK